MHARPAVTACLFAAALGACSGAPLGGRPAYPASAQREVHAVLQRDFHARGIATLARIEPDAVQRACNEFADNPPPELAARLMQEQMQAIPFPRDGVMGDWKSGQRIAQSGQGMTWSDRPGAANGGSCYNCHQLSPQEMSFGTLGPSLLGFGRLRGSGAEMQKYVYGKVFNAKAYLLCSQMPRLGHSGTLTDAQIRDVVAYLLDPASPVNR